MTTMEVMATPVKPFIPHPTLRRTTADGRTWSDILKWITKGYTISDDHILDGPNAVYKPIPESTTQPFIVPHSAILHTNAGSTGANSLWGWISQAKVTGEPHFQVGYELIEQYMPLNRRADCNYSANRWAATVDGQTVYRGAISFETTDNGSATLDKTPWTMEQLSSMIGALTAICVVYNVSCVEPPYWDASGIGHHTLFPFQGIGYPAWSNVRGKTCPGAARKLQMPWIRQAVANNLAEFGRETGWKCRGAV